LSGAKIKHIFKTSKFFGQKIAKTAKKVENSSFSNKKVAFCYLYLQYFAAIICINNAKP